MKRKAIFLDRDGTLNVDVGYLHRLEDLELFPWTGDALRLLKRAGYVLVVVTNQSGIAHGLIAPEFVPACHEEMRRRLRRPARISTRCISAITIRAGRSPSWPSIAAAASRCRAWSTTRSAIFRSIPRSPGWSATSGSTSISATRSARASILVRTGWGVEQERQRPEGQRVDAICDNLIHAVSVIIASDDARQKAESPAP